MKNFLLIAFIFTLIGCDDENDVTYFGGEIVNPKTNFVVLYKDDTPIDTAELDDHHRFLFTLNTADDGLYYFYNQPEYQYIILEKGDSLLLRLNTYDFHESLVYSGKGAEKNNVLIAQYLKDKKDKDFVKDHLASKSPELFKKGMDSMYNSKISKLEKFYEDYDISDFSEEVLTSNAGYRLFRYAEIYPYLHQKFTGKSVTKLPDDFYDYREHLNITNDEYAYFDPYLRYLKLYASGKAYDYAFKKNKSFNVYQLIQSNDYHRKKLAVIDSVLKETPTSRTKLLRNAAYTFYLDEKRDTNFDDSYLDYFKSFVSDTSLVYKEVNEIHDNLENLKQGKRFEHIKLINFNGKEVNMECTNYNMLTVYYFWSRHQTSHFKDILNRVHMLEDKYPKVNFVGVNKDLSQNNWKKTLETYRLNPEQQYRIHNFDSVSRKLMLNKRNKVIIINKDETIIDAFADIYDTNFETLLSSYRGDLSKKK